MPRGLVRCLSLAASFWLLEPSPLVFAAETSAATVALDLNPAVKAGNDLPRLRSLLVSRHDELILEHYFHGTRATNFADVKSVSKSIISALVGIAIDRGLLSGVEETIGRFFPELSAPKTDARKRKITIEDLLTMRSGLQSTSRWNYGAWVQSPNWVHFILSRPLQSVPGGRMDYSTGNTHLLSAILTSVSGGDTWKFAEEALAKPAGFTLARWFQDPQGIYFGGNEMLLTPRQMIKFGELYLHRGRIGNRQVVPAAWIETSFVPRTESPVSGQLYGYGWWIGEMGGHRTNYAWGFGGQYVFIVPDLDLVVVTTSSPNVGEDRREHRAAVQDLVEHLVIEPIAATK